MTVDRPVAGVLGACKGFFTRVRGGVRPKPSATSDATRGMWGANHS